MGDVIDILEDLIEKINKKAPSSTCLASSLRQIEKHQMGFNGEHIGQSTLKKMKYKGVKTTRHKDPFDIITGNTAWEVKTLSHEAKHIQMSVKPAQKASKLAWAEANNKRVKSMLVIVNDGKAEIFVKDGLGKFRPGGMKKVRTITDWRNEVGYGRSTQPSLLRESIEPK